MQLAEYLRRRGALTAQKERGYCPACHRPPVACFCAQLKRFDPGIRFLILTHIREAQKRIATGRLSALSLEGSRQLVGEDFSEDREANLLLTRDDLHAVVLYPGQSSLNLSSIPAPARRESFPPGKQLLVIVIDGTWNTAPKMLAKSRNLHGLARISYDPPGPSQFLVRRQPAPHCHSTVEAIHQVIELLGPAYGYEGRDHDRLLQAFQRMVEQQKRSQEARRAVTLTE